MSHFQPKFPSPYMHARVMEAADGGSFLVGQDSDNPAQGMSFFLLEFGIRLTLFTFMGQVLGNSFKNQKCGNIVHHFFANCRPLPPTRQK